MLLAPSRAQPNVGKEVAAARERGCTVKNKTQQQEKQNKEQKLASEPAGIGS